MHQERIMDILKTAARLGTERRTLKGLKASFPSINRAIGEEADRTLKELQGALHEHETVGTNAVMRVLVGQVFMDTFISHPAHLPFLFPFFATLCGDRHPSETIWHASPDWDFMDNSDTIM